MTACGAGGDGMSPNVMTCDERRQLRQFLDLYDRMVHSRFFTDLRSRGHLIHFQADEDGDLQLTSPEYDEEDFRAFGTYYRPVGIDPKGPAFLPKVREVLWRHHPAHRPLLDLIQAEIEPRLWWNGNVQVTPNPDGSTSFNSHA